uniref:Uncharacterized protein n=1 Tax=Vitis vinifera TaxID=29760 RepID=A5BL73_VITVI|nr:hypothetical protein VITISV_003926 [Vitis vinifera]
MENKEEVDKKLGLNRRRRVVRRSTHVYTLDVGHSNKHYVCLTNHIYVIWTPYHMVEESPSETQIVAKFNWVYATQLCGSISKACQASTKLQEEPIKPKI